MKFYTNLTRSTDIITEVCHRLLEGHNINITKTSLKKELEGHPDYPSILAMGDTLKKFHVPNIAARLSLEKLRNIPRPFLVSIKTETEGKNYFSMVKEMDDSQVKITDDEGKDKKVTLEEFESVYGGIAFLIEKTDKSEEEDYKSKKYQELLNTFLLDVSLWIIPILVILNIGIFSYKQNIFNTVLSNLYQLLSLFGWSVCVLIMWYEVDHKNKALKKVCGISQQTSSCGAVFQSRLGTIFGFSWGNVGFGYFSALLFIQGCNQFMESSVGTFLPLVSSIAFLFIPFSIYYQKMIVKQWCRLCLMVQGILFLHFIIVVIWVFSGEINVSGEDKLNLFFLLILGGVVPFVIAKQILDLSKERKNLRETNRELNKSRFNASLFTSMLKLQKQVTIDPKGLGILLGNTNAKHRIIKVCSPYCGPCAAIHDVVDELLDDSNFSVQIIFTASSAVNDPTAIPVRHFLAIAQQGDEKATRQMLHDWYSSPIKDYTKFLSTHPIDIDLSLQDVKIEHMWDWCNKMQVAFTPTFFINGNQLPEIYTINEAGILLGN